MHRPKNPTEGPFHMKYTKEEKIAWAKEWLKHGTVDPPESFKGTRSEFTDHAREWARMLEEHGEAYFEPHYRQLPLSMKLEVVSYAEESGTIAAAICFGIQSNTVRAWRKKFHEQGIDGLKCKPKGRQRKMPDKETPKAPPKAAEDGSSELEKALAENAALQAKLHVCEQKLKEDEIRIEFLKKAQALAKVGRKRRQ